MSKHKTDTTSNSKKIIQGMSCLVYLLDRKLEERFGEYFLEYQDIEDKLFFGITRETTSWIDGHKVSFDSLQEVYLEIAQKIYLKHMVLESRDETIGMMNAYAYEPLFSYTDFNSSVD